MPINKVAAALLSFEVRSFGGSRWAGDGATREDIGGEDLQQHRCSELFPKRKEHPYPPRRKGRGGGVCLQPLYFDAPFACLLRLVWLLGLLVLGVGHNWGIYFAFPFV